MRSMADTAAKGRGVSRRRSSLNGGLRAAMGGMGCSRRDPVVTFARISKGLRERGGDLVLPHARISLVFELATVLIMRLGARFAWRLRLTAGDYLGGGSTASWLSPGAAVYERLACSPPIKALHVGIVPDDAVGQRVFSWISRFPALSFRRCPILTSITLSGSQDLGC
ncbi:hypothetical protein PR048_032217 [Dryococelus australis]|uniref:Uncharacterized protein n=1 Tax=Dryococelus australis TaxID=614101 RepID=A0ABQ9G1L9_9NEOP|nr:hypothetical protein PR048_032217 [Dryococelus australis]